MPTLFKKTITKFRASVTTPFGYAVPLSGYYALLLFVGALAFHGSFFNAAHAQEETAVSEEIITIAGTSINNVFDPLQPGPYNIIYARINAGFRPEPELLLLPFRRAQRAFYVDRADCLFVGTNDTGVLTSYGYTPDEMVFSTPVNETKLRVFSQVGTTPPHSKKDIENTMIAVDVAAGPSRQFRTRLLPQSTEFIQANSIQQAFAMLDSGRVHYVVAFDYDVQLQRARLPDIKQYTFDEDFSLITSQEVVACHSNPRTKRLIAHINDQIESMQEDGSLKKLIETHLLAASEPAPTPQSPEK